ncbi:MAG: hypothetical protein KC713_04380, partial [Candidatus Omnitrophica bacterium]|nr:hypothetical protein [Candidatus Omnitrophota bacterium]
LTKENPINEIVRLPMGFGILHLDNSLEIDQDEYEKNKEEFSKKLEIEKRNEIFAEYLSLLRIKANIDDQLPRRETQTEAP